MKRFNVTGTCVPGKHYMVDTGKKLKEIIKLIDDEHYFTINRARQYGKTTTLHLLEKALSSEYTVVRISFEGTGDTMFSSEEAFCQAFLRMIHGRLKNTDIDYAALWQDGEIASFDILSDHLNTVCYNKKIVLMIDEVDKSSNNRIFLHFIGMLRMKYLERHDDYVNTFHSVILAGVYDIRNIKLKLDRGKGEQTDSGQLLNSPWNIAVAFDVDMSFNPAEIETMLADYETDHKTGMDIAAIATEIHSFTSGYPFLVSRICQCIDNELGRDWSSTGIQGAVKIITAEKSVLFDDMFKNLENDRKLYDFMYAVVMIGERKTFILDDPIVEWCHMFGFIAPNEQNVVNVANKIFALRMSLYFMSKDRNAMRISSKICNTLIHDVINGDKFNMELCLRKFAEYYGELFTPSDAPFLEKHGRLVFLTFLSPTINGHGFYHIESQLTDLRRMDIVVNFGNEQYIVELKTWKGEAAREKAYDQLLGYMETKRADKGYLLTFDFRKEENKERIAEWVQIGDKQIFDVVV